MCNCMLNGTFLSQNCCCLPEPQKQHQTQPAGLGQRLRCPHPITCLQTHSDLGEEERDWDLPWKELSKCCASPHKAQAWPPGLPWSWEDTEPETTSHMEKSEDKRTVGAAPGGSPNRGWGLLWEQPVLPEFGNKMFLRGPTGHSAR